MLSHLDLFSGIGGFSLGFERAGIATAAFCECDAYARAVIAQHWPAIPIYPDVRRLTGAQLAADGIAPDIISGGFPCQDISYNGHGAGLAGERSALWWEYHRIIAETSPRWVVIENVAALQRRGLGIILRSLADIGFDAEWHRIAASDVGADHWRPRTWIVAYPARFGMEGLWPQGFTISRALDRQVLSVRACDGKWKAEPDLRRVPDGVPAWMDRLRCLGNAALPQITELIGHAIVQRHRERNAVLR